jgi:hypothetical protein
MARRKRASVVSSETTLIRAVSVAKLTVADSTPGIFFSAFSTRPTHEAQVMPPMPMS